MKRFEGLSKLLYSSTCVDETEVALVVVKAAIVQWLGVTVAREPRIENDAAAARHTFHGASTSASSKDVRTSNERRRGNRLVAWPIDTTLIVPA